MKKKTVIPYSAAFVYEIVKVLYIASFSAHYTPDLLLFKYTVIAALCVPVLPWLMLALNEKAFYWALYAAALFKLSSVCAEFLYIFQRGFAIIKTVFNSVQSSSLDFSKEVLFFLAADTVLLFYSFIKGSMYYANNTDC